MSYRVIAISILLTCLPTRCRHLPVRGRCLSPVMWTHPLPQYPLILPPSPPRRRLTNTRLYVDSVRCHALAVTLQGRQGARPSPLQRPSTTTGSWRGRLSRYDRFLACVYKTTTFLMSNMRWCIKKKMERNIHLVYFREDWTFIVCPYLDTRIGKRQYSGEIMTWKRQRQVIKKCYSVE